MSEKHTVEEDESNPTVNTDSSTDSVMPHIRLITFIILLLASLYLSLKSQVLLGAASFFTAIGLLLYWGKKNEDMDLSDVADEIKKEISSNPDVDDIADVLDEGEAVEHLTRGRTIDVEGSGSGSSFWGKGRDRKSGTKGDVITAMTDRRVVIKIPQFTGDDERTIPYNSITSVDLDTGLIHKRISLQTAGQTYHIEVLNPDKEECREAVRFIRKKMGEPTETISSETDPINQLERLKRLYEDGTLTEKEFTEQKEKLLDKI